jgi:hypothetical protein
VARKRNSPKVEYSGTSRGIGVSPGRGVFVS